MTLSTCLQADDGIAQCHIIVGTHIVEGHVLQAAQHYHICVQIDATPAIEAQQAQQIGGVLGEKAKGRRIIIETIYI